MECVILLIMTELAARTCQRCNQPAAEDSQQFCGSCGGQLAGQGERRYILCEIGSCKNIATSRCDYWWIYLPRNEGCMRCFCNSHKGEGFLALTETVCSECDSKVKCCSAIHAKTCFCTFGIVLVSIAIGFALGVLTLILI